MLPTTLARGRATARGYGELLTMLNTPGLNTPALNTPGLNTPGSIQGLNTYRYSPYTIPNAAAGSAQSAAAQAQAAAHAAAVAAAASPQPPTVTSTHQPPTVTPIISQAQIAPQPNTAQHAHTTLTPAHLQQLQLLGLVGQIQPTPHQPPVTTSAGHLAAALNNNSPLAAQILALNNQAVQAAAAVAAQQAGTLTGVQAGQPCKQRASALPAALIDQGHAGQPATVSHGLNYSMNDLINLQGLQFDAASAANFQVPVGL